MNIRYFRDDPFNEYDILEMVKSRLDIETKKPKNFDAVASIDVFDNFQDIKSIAELLRRLSTVKEYRHEVINRSNRIVRGILNDVARTLGISYDDLVFLNCEEIFTCLQGKKPNLMSIIERKEDYGVICFEGNIRWYSGKELSDLLEMDGTKSSKEIILFE